MKDWLSDREKSILFSALTREKKVCAEVDKESCRELYKESLVSTVESLEHKFYYDRLFKQMEKQIRSDVIKEVETLMSQFDDYCDARDCTNCWIHEKSENCLKQWIKRKLVKEQMNDH